ncbi:hypothetical protein F511_40820 [Dorcoceras hygrometricum]|uniref:Mucin-2-like n=1 Tax=Dorcoceras hygrometricum TaxID=472368 RepID=A0A2Z7CHV3_9LAMI|nr:hypothetical protein F511_40820 [Dorcoceras hygrometricum]
MEPALDTPLNKAQQDLTGNPNPVVIDLTNFDSTQDQISSSVPAAGDQATNAQTYAAQTDVAQTDLAIHRPTSYAPVASTSHKLVSRPTSDAQDANANHQFVIENPEVTIQQDIQAEKGANPIGLDSGTLSFVTLSAMASSLVSNTNQVHFASVLAMDNSEMVAMFEALVASGLNGFLGCMSEISETALNGFYENSFVRDDKVVTTVHGKLVEISEEVFARTFQLPVEGLIDISEVPKDLIFDARTEFSLTGEQLTTSCKKRELKIEYRLLSDIVAKSITVKAGSFSCRWKD